MSDVSDDAKRGFRRIEVLTGPGRRRRWSAEEKARVVAETLVPGTSVSEVARRWQLCAQQVFGWRRQARIDVSEQAPAPVSCAPAFVPIVSEAATVPKPVTATSSAAIIEIKLAGAVVRVWSGTDDAAQLTAVLRAVRASASGS
jgi:transposase